MKKVNDTYGHKEGDLLIKHIVTIINGNISDSDTLIRLSGDEFIIILPNKNLSNALITMEKINYSLDNYNKKRIKAYLYSISCGMVQYSYGLDLETFVNLADKEMYKAKLEHYERQKQMIIR